MNLLDRAIATVAPQYAAANAKARLQLQVLGSMEALSSQNTGSSANGRWWWPMARDAKSDTLRQLTPMLSVFHNPPPVVPM